MYCAECGTKLPATAMFCLECGHEREGLASTPEPVVPPPAVTSDGHPVDPTRDVWGRPVASSDDAACKRSPATAQRVLPRAARAEPYVAPLNRRQSIRGEVSSTPGLLAIAAAALVIVGSLGPWVSIVAPFVGSLSVSGTDGDGKLSLVCGLAATVLLAFLVTSNRSSVWLGVLAAVVLGIAGAIGVYDWQNIGAAAGVADDDIALLARVGWGLKAMTLGAIAGTVLSITQAIKATDLT